MQHRLQVLWLNRSAIIKQSNAWTGIVFTIWGIVCMFDVVSKLIDESTGCWYRLLYGILFLVLTWLLMAIIASIRICCARKETIIIAGNNHKVEVDYGDVMDPFSVCEKGEKKVNVVIPVNRCFDTIVNDELISHRTLHGKVMQHLYDTKEMDYTILNKQIQNYLAKHNSKFEILTQEQKPQGNRKRYDAGTIVIIPVGNDVNYYFLGLSKFNHELAASTSKAEYAEAIQKMIEFCDMHAQGNPVVLPLIGTGHSRVRSDLQQSLDYLVSAFNMNKDKITCDFHIVVWEGDRDKVLINK